MIGKRVLLGLCVFLPLCVLTGCKKTTTYADYVEDENEAIAQFIKSHQIVEKSVMPTEAGEWKEDGKDVYYHYSSGAMDGLYYHQVELGDGEQVPQTNWTAYVRYVGYTLKGDRIYDCSAAVSPNPQSFVILSDAYGARFGRGFQQAVRNLRVGGHCSVIIPFSLGNENNTTLTGGTRSDYKNYQPMFYEIWLVGLD